MTDKAVVVVLCIERETLDKLLGFTPNSFLPLGYGGHNDDDEEEQDGGDDGNGDERGGRVGVLPLLVIRQGIRSTYKLLQRPWLDWLLAPRLSLCNR